MHEINVITVYLPICKVWVTYLSMVAGNILPVVESTTKPPKNTLRRIARDLRRNEEGLH